MGWFYEENVERGVERHFPHLLSGFKNIVIVAFFIEI